MFSQFFMYIYYQRSTIDLFSVLLTSFFKQGNTAFRFDGITAKNREEKKSLPAICVNLFPYTVSPSRVGRRRQASSNGN